MSSTGADHIDQLLRDGIQAARGGDHARALRLFGQATRLQPANARAWLWLAHATPEVVDKRGALARALRLRPADARVRRSLQKLLSVQHVRQAARGGVFISYARADDVFAITLTEDLRAAGLDVWLDMTDIADDSTWHSAVSRALRRAGLLLALLSPAAVASEDMRAERDWFYTTGKVVLPVLCRDCVYEAASFYLPSVDFRADYGAGLRRLCAVLGAAAPR